MAKSTDRPEEQNDVPPVPREGDRHGPAGPALPREATRPEARAMTSIDLDDSRAVASYANFCRVTGTPEELIIDFGVNSQPFGPQTAPIPVTQRIITNYFTAKRLLQVLHMTVQRHEATFGVLEIDVAKRAGRGPHVEPPPGIIK